MPEWINWGRTLASQTRRVYQVIDLFGASQKVSNTWKQEGFNAAGYDIKLSTSHDICSENGFRELLKMGCQGPVSCVDASQSVSC